MASLLKLYNINTSSLIDEAIVLWFDQIAIQEDMAELMAWKQSYYHRVYKNNFRHTKMFG